MAERLFSVNRRRPHIVDLYTPFVQGVDLYRLKWNANFDGVFVDFLDSTNIGYLDPAININVIETQPTSGTWVRIVFDPTTYNIPDGASFWLKLARVVGVVETVVGAPTLVLPDEALHGTGMVVISGAAPANPLQLDLPRRMEDFRFVNEDGMGGNTLYIGTEDGGPVMSVLPAVGVQNLGFRGAQGTIYVSGDVAFSATFTQAFPR
jgi:hypothetical protein